MQTYTGLIQDERYSVPTLMIIAAQGDAQARAIAQQDLMENPHHLSIELRDCDDRLLLIERRQAPPGADI